MSKRHRKVREMMSATAEDMAYAPSYASETALKGKRPKNKRQRGTKPAYWD